MTPSTAESVVTVPMPRLSDSMEEGVVVRWLVAEGEEVERGQEVVEIETDKATMSYEAPAAGPIFFLAAENATVAVGEPIATIGGRAAGDEEAAVADPPPPADAVPAPEPAVPAPEPAAATREPAAPAEPAGRGPRISPVARRLAAELGVAIENVSGSGPGGRIVKQDVQAAAERGGTAGASTPESSRGAPADPSSGTARGGSERIEPTRSQAIVARRMAEARATVPEFPVQIEVAVDALGDLRRQLRAELDPAPTLNDFLLAAVGRTLAAHPRLNSAYVDAGFELFSKVNVGMAVAAGDELLVPVLRGADRLPLPELALESRRLAERARSGAITPPELAGGTFTVSNLGMFGIASFQPIVNPPQAAILGVGGAREEGGRATMNLTLVSDHRIVYGAHAASFLADLRDLLESPARLLLPR